MWRFLQQLRFFFGICTVKELVALFMGNGREIVVDAQAALVDKYVQIEERMITNGIAVVLGDCLQVQWFCF